MILTTTMSHTLGSLRSLLGAIALTVAACSSSAGDVAASGALHSGWHELHPEPGVTLQMPNGWSASRAESGKGPILFAGPGGARVLALPVFLPSDSAQPGPELVVSHFARAHRPNLNWMRPQRSGRSVTRMVGNDGTQVALATFAYRNSPAGVAGYFFLTEARADQYAQLQATFAGILAGLRITGTGDATQSAAPRRASIRYVAWRDPTEAAFSTQVPAGWQVSGGIVRTSPLQLAMPMRLISPDEQIALFIGDPALAAPAAFIVPTQMLLATGFGEGARYNTSIVSRYQVPTQFLPGYVANTFRATCTRTRIIHRDDFPAVRQQLDAVAQSSSLPGTSTRLDLGLVAFECDTPKGTMAGIAFARTRAIVMHGAAMGMGEDMTHWDVDLLLGCIAHPTRLGEGLEVLGKVIASWQIDPRWAGGNAQVAADVSRITTDAANYTSRILTETYAQAAMRGSENIRIQSNRILDTVDVVDPATNQQYKIDSTSNYYWINPAGTIVGTDISARPDVDYAEMVQLP